METLKFEKLFEIANQTKHALVGQWMKNRTFTDKNNLTESGIFAEGIGLTGLLLLLVAFKDEENIISAEDKENFSELITESLRMIREWSKDGFTAAPLLNPIHETGEDALFKGDFGYTDTVTWCLSSAILARYAVARGAYVPDEETNNGIIEMIKRALAAILSAQRPDGTWGFATDTSAKRSLYFTYTASTTLADFFDYILGEIGEVEANNEGSIEISVKDEALLTELDKTFGKTEEKVRAARASLQHFLLYDCLPLLPKLANCGSLSPEECERLGIDIQNPVRGDDGSERFYYNLYYAYYLLDMMITSSADVCFETLATGEEARTLQEYYIANKLLSKSEQKYYTGSNARNFSEFFASYYEQALHATRVWYMNAKRTGTSFWNTTKSELPVYWRFENSERDDEAITALDRSTSKNYVTDPAVVSMALRANTIYSYYFTQKEDKTVERLFDDICSNVYADESDAKRVKGLWDDLSFNLAVTEKSIESIIDFYDYLCRFAHEEVSTSASVAVTSSTAQVAKSALDLAIEQKIEEYLASEAGQARILAVIEDRLSAAPAAVGTTADATGTLDDDALIRFLNEKTAMLSRICAIDPKKPTDRLAEALVSFSNELELCKLKQLIVPYYPYPSAEIATVFDQKNVVNKAATTIQSRYQELVGKKLARDTKYKLCKFTNLYDRVTKLPSTDDEN